jgi:hypothetical protein
MQLIVGSRKRGVVTSARDNATTIFTVVIVLTPDMTILAQVPSTTIAAVATTALFVFSSPTLTPASLTTSFPTPTSTPAATKARISIFDHAPVAAMTSISLLAHAPAAAAMRISLPAHTPAAALMTMTSLTDAAAATVTVAVMMIVLIIPALTAAETPALVAMTMMASTPISHMLPAATVPPLWNKRIISVAHQLNHVHIVVLCICLASIFFLLILA